MKLFVVRHGEAEPLKYTDAERALTAKGVVDAQALGRLLAREHIQWDAIVVSPYLRARQTLDNILLAFSLPQAITVNAAITPENAVSDAFAALQPFEHLQNVLLVSHMPLVSALVATLDFGSQRNASHYSMNTASMAELELDCLCMGAGKLKRLIAPPYAA